jgi:hypothetical protein
MDSGTVWVLPGILPASMSVAPNSPSARAKARTSPARMPLRARGSVTSIAVRHSERPSVKAAFSSSRSTEAMAAAAVRTRSGKAITVAAMAAAYQVNATVKPVAS